MGKSCLVYMKVFPKSIKCSTKIKPFLVLDYPFINGHRFSINTLSPDFPFEERPQMLKI